MRFVLAAVILSCLSSGAAFAQEPPAPQDPPPAQPVISQAVNDAIADALAAPLNQQPPPPVTRTGFHAYFYSVAHDFAAMPKLKASYAAVGGAGLLALAVHPADDDINEHFASHAGFWKLGKYLGQSYTIAAASFATYLIGRTTDNEKVTHIGIDELRALLETEAIVQTLKYTVRRERPDGSGKSSFPSGHAADTFAAATVLQRHFGPKAAIPSYLLASYVAMSRLHENRHFMSDVIFGAGIGYMVGHTVTRHGRGNFVEFAMYPVVVPRGVGIMVVRIAN
jgi:membrane-associated phospholipid phosphatase